MTVLPGHEAKQRHQQHRASVLRWLAQERYSTADVLAQVIGYSHTRRVYPLLRAMAADGLLIRDEVLAAGGRVVLWGISTTGLAYAGAEVAGAHEPGRVAVAQLGHDLDAQRIGAAAWRAGYEWRGLRQLRAEDLAQRPDGVIRDGHGRAAAVEVERSIKTPRRYRSILAGHLRAIREGHYSHVAYVLPDDQLALRLPAIHRDLGYVLYSGERVQLKDKHLSRFAYHPLPMAVEEPGQLIHPQQE